VRGFILFGVIGKTFTKKGLGVVVNVYNPSHGRMDRRFADQGQPEAKT
jgi:hypothetical protein